MKTITLELTDDLHEECQAIATENDMSVQEFILDAIEGELELIDAEEQLDEIMGEEGGLERLLDSLNEEDDDDEDWDDEDEDEDEDYISDEDNEDWDDDDDEDEDEKQEVDEEAIH